MHVLHSGRIPIDRVEPARLFLLAVESTMRDRPWTASVIRAVVAFGLVVDLVIFRSVLLGREAFLFRFSALLVPFAAMTAVWLVACFAHVATVLRDARTESVPTPEARDSRALYVGSAVVALAYVVFHLAVGPLGTFVRCGDAFTLYASLRESCPTVAAAGLHAMGLVAIGLHGYELSIRVQPTERGTRLAAAFVAFAVAHAALALDPIALLTVGKPLFGHLDPRATVIVPTNSATVEP